MDVSALTGVPAAFIRALESLLPSDVDGFADLSRDDNGFDHLTVLGADATYCYRWQVSARSHPTPVGEPRLVTSTSCWQRADLKAVDAGSLITVGANDIFHDGITLNVYHSSGLSWPEQRAGEIAPDTIGEHRAYGGDAVAALEALRRLASRLCHQSG